MIHQHFMLVDTFTVLENLILGAEDRFWVRPSLAKARAQLTGIAETYGLKVDPDALMQRHPRRASNSAWRS